MPHLFGSANDRALARRLRRHPALASFDRNDALKLIKMCTLMERRASRGSTLVFLIGYLALSAIWGTTFFWPRFAGLSLYRPGIIILSILPLLAQAWAVVFAIRFNRRIARQIDDQVRLLLAAGDGRLPACPECGYDLRGSTSPGCPECGGSISVPITPRPAESGGQTTTPNPRAPEPAPRLNPRVRLICLGCGYDLHVSPGPDCPECGRTFGDPTQLRQELGREFNQSGWHPAFTFAVPILNGLLVVFIAMAALLFIADPLADHVIDFFLILNSLAILVLAYEFARRAVIRRALTAARPCHPRDLSRTCLLALAFAAWHVACIVAVVACGAFLGLGILFRFFPFRVLFP